jgi:putative ABC transport system permease protein
MRTQLALRSLWNRRLAVGLTITAIALSTAMIIGVERIRSETRENFTSTIAGTDLIVGARTGPIALLLSSVFRIGDATSNLRWESYQKIARHPNVAWSIPLSLGDSHRGFRVLGTTNAYFDHFRYGDDNALQLVSGRTFVEPLDVVLGAAVASELGYRLNDQLTIAHGTRDDGLSGHDELPFTVVGILASTGTPADRTVHVSLAGIEAIHTGWESGVPVAGATLDTEHLHDADLEPEFITAFLLGLEQRSTALQFQRAINNFPDEPLLGILPGVALNELWSLFGTAELALVAVALMTVVTGLLGMVVGIFSTLNERRREMAVLRSVGARPLDIFSLLIAESGLIGLLGAAIGYLLLTAALQLANLGFAADMGLRLSAGTPSTREVMLLLAIMLAAVATGAIPAWRAYRLSLHDGLTAGN